jgi:hypothetical protein
VVVAAEGQVVAVEGQVAAAEGVFIKRHANTATKRLCIID